MKTAAVVGLVLMGWGVAIPSRAEEIRRATFAVSLPDGWKEDTKDPPHDPGSYAVFVNEKEASGFSVVVARKDPGLDLEAALAKRRETTAELLSEPSTTSFGEWSSYRGRGYRIVGTLGGKTARFDLFAFERGEYVCLIVAYGPRGEGQAFDERFEKIRGSFRLTSSDVEAERRK